MSSDFGYSLPLLPGADRLEFINKPNFTPDRLHETVTITSHAFDRPVDMEITSLFTGERATSMRAYLADATTPRLTRDYLNYYLQKFPGLTSTEPVTWIDDRDTNQLRVTERYLLPDFWSKPAADGVITTEIYPHAIGQLTGSPAGQDRRAPLAIAYPSETLVTMVVRLHSDWTIRPLDETIDNTHFQYVSSTRYADRVLTLSYFLRNRYDHVAAHEVPAYARALAEVREDLTLRLTHTPGEDAPAAPGFRLNPWAVVAAVLGLLGSGWIAWRVLARRRAPGVPPPLPPTEPALAIGGWLLLVAIGLVLRPIGLVTSLIPMLPTFFDAEIWAVLTGPDPESRNLPVALLMLVEIAINTALFVFTALAVILFFTRRREAPRWMIVILGGTAAFLVLDTIAASALADATSNPEEIGQLVGACLVALIWVPYFLVSERVKATFVR
jgi:hypothetical protein